MESRKLQLESTPEALSETSISAKEDIKREKSPEELRAESLILDIEKFRFMWGTIEEETRYPTQNKKSLEWETQAHL